MKAGTTLIVFFLYVLHSAAQISWELFPLSKGNTRGSEIITALRNEEVIVLNDYHKDLLHDEEWKLPGKLHPVMKIGNNGFIDLKDSTEVFFELPAGYEHGTRSWSPFEFMWYACLIQTNPKGDDRWQIATWKEGSAATWIDLGMSDYNVIHPFISEYGDELVFASDAPGGQGGFDIYISYKQGETWSKPVPVVDINTDADEVFPTRWHHRLCFSSNRSGNLDLYHYDFLTAMLERFPEPVNSEANELNMVFKGSDWAYISSDRKGGKGKEDLYIVRRLIQEFANQKARLVLGSDPIVNTKVEIFDELGISAGSYMTDDNGYFTMTNLVQKRRYRIQADLDSKILAESAKVELLNSKSEVVSVIQSGSKSSFWFEMLPFEDFDPVKRVYNPDETVLLSIRITGQIYENKPGDIGSGEAVILLDQSGKADELTYTDEQGKFAFEEVLPKSGYNFALTENTDAQKLQLDGLEPVDIANNQAFVQRFSEKEMEQILLSDGRVMEFKPGESMLISNIEYGFDKALPEMDGLNRLKKIAALLKNNPKFKVIIKSHTDSRGSDDYNLELSIRRAQLVQDELLLSGLTKSSIEVFGMGETELLNQCDDFTECDESQHSINRRTEIVISLK
jgi:outer membrane protein OmpA-like peptidoglycan-associated protein